MDVATEVHGDALIHRVSGRIETGTAADAERKLTPKCARAVASCWT